MFFPWGCVGLLVGLEEAGGAGQPHRAGTHTRPGSATLPLPAPSARSCETVLAISSLLLLFLKIYGNIFNRISSAPGCALALQLLHLQSCEELGEWGLLIAAIYTFHRTAPWLRSLCSVCSLELKAQSQRELRFMHPGWSWDVPFLPRSTSLLSQLGSVLHPEPFASLQAPFHT